MANSRVCLFRHSLNTIFPPSSTSIFSRSVLPARRFVTYASISSKEPLITSNNSENPNNICKNTRWKPMCLYYTQDKCTMMEDSCHLQKFNHSFCLEDFVDGGEYKNRHSEDLDYFLVLDLEGKVEILEFPVLMIDARSMDVVAFFHRFVRPSEMSEERINQYIEGKYGKLRVDRVWHDTAIPFDEVIAQFEEWMQKHSLCSKEPGGPLHRAAFVTCGNWDIKTKIPQQCKVAKMKLPSYFMEWINLKDIYLNFYKRRAAGMRTMMNELKIPLLGSHHLGIDDTKNIARLLQRMLIEGAVLKITARRNPSIPEKLDIVELIHHTTYYNESFFKANKSFDTDINTPHPKTLPYNKKEEKGKSNLQLSISTFGYQILQYPHFAELYLVTSKLIEGPSAEVDGPWKGWPYNSCIVRPNDGLSAYRGVYLSLREVSASIRRVLEILTSEINAKVKWLILTIWSTVGHTPCRVWTLQPMKNKTSENAIFQGDDCIDKSFRDQTEIKLKNESNGDVLEQSEPKSTETL